MTDIDITDAELWAAIELFNSIKPIELEYRVYYDSDGKIITYTTELLDGDSVVITREQYSEARHDAKVIDGQLTMTNRISHVYKLARSTEGVRTSKYDVGVISDDENDQYWSVTANEIKR